jgi:hypothetical protein
LQVIPIYGRGGNEDPRAKTKGQEQSELVPQRPAGQRPTPVVRNPLLQPNVNVNAQQNGLGIIPTLFGLQQNNGEQQRELVACGKASRQFGEVAVFRYNEWFPCLSLRITWPSWLWLVILWPLL